ncbi:MAG: gamma-glutamylcyclotransferase family protein [Myxococcota bacterium]
MTDALPLFVYGTLMAGQAQAGLLGALGRRAAQVRGALYRLPAGYPALVADDAGWVHGELVDPPSAPVLALLDTYEGVDEGLYRRIVCDVRVGLRTQPAWAYVMDAAQARRGRRVEDGRWRPVRRR